MTLSMTPVVPENIAGQLLKEIRPLIEETRARVAQAVNAGLVPLYWRIGKTIREHILGEEGAAYGDRVVEMLAELTELPPIPVLEARLREAIRHARNRLFPALEEELP